ncbi:hypothetical protein HDU98_007469 [Podochytrium sp. JEL0797]|nr:hypothetical protein HDU98_007469 [Podochytrium sp. JEL0797]
MTTFLYFYRLLDNTHTPLLGTTTDVLTLISPTPPRVCEVRKGIFAANAVLLPDRVASQLTLLGPGGVALRIGDVAPIGLTNEESPLVAVLFCVGAEETHKRVVPAPSLATIPVVPMAPPTAHHTPFPHAPTVPVKREPTESAPPPKPAITPAFLTAFETILHHISTTTTQTICMRDLESVLWDTPLVDVDLVDGERGWVDLVRRVVRCGDDVGVWKMRFCVEEGEVRVVVESVEGSWRVVRELKTGPLESSSRPPSVTQDQTPRVLKKAASFSNPAPSWTPRPPKTSAESTLSGESTPSFMRSRDRTPSKSPTRPVTLAPPAPPPMDPKRVPLDTPNHHTFLQDPNPIPTISPQRVESSVQPLTPDLKPATPSAPLVAPLAAAVPPPPPVRPVYVPSPLIPKQPDHKAMQLEMQQQRERELKAAAAAARVVKPVQRGGVDASVVVVERGGVASALRTAVEGGVKVESGVGGVAESRNESIGQAPRLASPTPLGGTLSTLESAAGQPQPVSTGGEANRALSPLGVVGSGETLSAVVVDSGLVVLEPDGTSSASFTPVSSPLKMESNVVGDSESRNRYVDETGVVGQPAITGEKASVRVSPLAVLGLVETPRHGVVAHAPVSSPTKMVVAAAVESRNGSVGGTGVESRIVDDGGEASLGVSPPWGVLDAGDVAPRTPVEGGVKVESGVGVVAESPNESVGQDDALLSQVVFETAGHPQQPADTGEEANLGLRPSRGVLGSLVSEAGGIASASSTPVSSPSKMESDVVVVVESRHELVGQATRVASPTPTGATVSTSGMDGHPQPATTGEEANVPMSPLRVPDSVETPSPGVVVPVSSLSTAQQPFENSPTRTHPLFDVSPGAERAFYPPTSTPVRIQNPVTRHPIVLPVRPDLRSPTRLGHLFDVSPGSDHAVQPLAQTPVRTQQLETGEEVVGPVKPPPPPPQVSVPLAVERPRVGIENLEDGCLVDCGGFAAPRGSPSRVSPSRVSPSPALQQAGGLYSPTFMYQQFKVSPGPDHEVYHPTLLVQPPLPISLPFAYGVVIQNADDGSIMGYTNVADPRESLVPGTQPPLGLYSPTFLHQQVDFTPGSDHAVHPLALHKPQTRVRIQNPVTGEIVLPPPPQQSCTVQSPDVGSPTFSEQQFDVSHGSDDHPLVAQKPVRDTGEEIDFRLSLPPPLPSAVERPRVVMKNPKDGRVVDLRDVASPPPRGVSPSRGVSPASVMQLPDVCSLEFSDQQIDVSPGSDDVVHPPAQKPIRSQNPAGEKNVSARPPLSTVPAKLFVIQKPRAVVVKNLDGSVVDFGAVVAARQSPSPINHSFDSSYVSENVVETPLRTRAVRMQDPVTGEGVPFPVRPPPPPSTDLAVPLIPRVVIKSPVDGRVLDFGSLVPSGRVLEKRGEVVMGPEVAPIVDEDVDMIGSDDGRVGGGGGGVVGGDGGVLVRGELCSGLDGGEASDESVADPVVLESEGGERSPVELLDAAIADAVVSESVGGESLPVKPLDSAPAIHDLENTASSGSLDTQTTQFESRASLEHRSDSMGSDLPPSTEPSALETPHELDKSSVLSAASPVENPEAKAADTVSRETSFDVGADDSCSGKGPQCAVM